MSHTLLCDFAVTSERGPIYWWPIIFDMMRWHAFDFSAPDLPEGNSRFFWTRGSENELETDTVEGPFQSLWDKVYVEGNDIGVIASFWHRDTEPLLLEVQVYPTATDNTIHIALLFEGAYVMNIPVEEARTRMKLVLACAKALYELFQSATGEMYWLFAGDRYAPWAIFGIFPEKPLQGGTSHGGPEKKVIEQVLPLGGRMYLLDPIPIPKKAGWDFISLSM